MPLTPWTDCSLRVLMSCAANEGRDTPATVVEIGQVHGISRSHLQKVVVALAALGYLETPRGRGGGLWLLPPAGEIRVGEVIRHTETNLMLLECFDLALNTCGLAGRCRLEAALHEAMARFIEVLDGLTLADLMTPDVQRFPLPPLPSPLPSSLPQCRPCPGVCRA